MKKEYYDGWNDYVNGSKKGNNNLNYSEGFEQAKGFEKIHNRKPFLKNPPNKIKEISIRICLNIGLFLYLIVTYTILIPFFYLVCKKNLKHGLRVK